MTLFYMMRSATDSNLPDSTNLNLEVKLRMPRFAVLVMIALVIAACGGEGGTTTVPGDGTTSGGADATNPPEQTTAPADDPGTITDINDAPPECIEAFKAYLQALEPYVQDIDFENATLTDLEPLFAELEPISSDFEDVTANCPELDATDEESLALMREFAEREVPGTAGYFAWIEESFAAVDAAAPSGDCETDIAAAQVYVDKGGTISDLTLAEITAVSNLMSAIGTECSLARYQEWLTQEDVATWSSG
ncbi:MAG TPA: hypothetical protein VI980_06885 [Acidimicrobiia bacterium]|nr:hypothetical protein [Acidimicrobiia bacterium]